MKNEAVQEFDALREAAFIMQAVKVQKHARKMVFKFKYRIWMKTLGQVKEAMASRSEPELVAALDLMNELPHGGRHLKLYKEANTLLQR